MSLMSEHEAVFAHIDRYFDDYVGQIQRFHRIPGISHSGEGIRESAELTRECMLATGTADAEIVETGGHPVVFGHLWSKRPGAKTVVLYSHYDMVPVVEKDWVTPPFEGRIVDASVIDAPARLGKVMVARASSDYRGPLMATMLIFQAMREAADDLPVNVVWAVEGEEEIGAPHIDQFIAKKFDDLRTGDALWMPGMHQNENGIMQIYRGYKGTVKIELEIKGGEWGGNLTGRDLWSALLPLVDAPMWRMIRVLNSLTDESDHLTIDGLEELIAPYADEDRQQLEVLKERFDDAQMKESIGVARFKGGKPLRDLVEDYVMRPMMNVVGIVGGYTGPRVFTTLPGKIVAKLDFRFTPNIKPADIPRLLRAHLDRRGFHEVKIAVHGGYDYSRTSATDPIYQAAFRACELHNCDYMVWPTKPAVAPFSKFNQPPLNLPVIFVGMGHGARWHEANEYITVEGIRDFMKYTVTFLNEWARL